MKTITVLLAFALGAAFALVASFASFSPDRLAVGIAVISTGALLQLAFGDYARKPRFRPGHNTTGGIRAATPATGQVNPACEWTYTTVSA